MFRLEKVFQNDDSGYLLFSNFIKSLVLFLSIYIFVILKENSIFELFNLKIFRNSNFFYFSIFFITIYFLFPFFFYDKRIYKKNFLTFLKEDISNLLISFILAFSLIFLFALDVIFDEGFFFLFSILIINLCLLKLYFNFLYQKLIDDNIIQKNIMIVGTYDEIIEVLKNSFDKIYIFKCCMMTDYFQIDKKIARSEIKFPIFNLKEDIRSILEYHSLGQIWILNGNKKKNSDILSSILKYSVDTLNISLDKNINIKGKKLLANKYDFEIYEMSRFYGINLFLKILIDKFLAIIFLLITSPVLLFSAILIYIEDGFPILFTQNRTGWDGRRFKIFKLRSLKKAQFDKTEQVKKNDDRVLKIGKFIRRYSVDELPQFINVLKGEMSIVGPRPHMVEHDIYYSSIFSSFLKRHKCNPGLTGWAQVNGLRGATPSPEIMKRRMEFDLWYLNNWSIYLDIYIIFKTFYALFKYKGD